MGKIIGIFSIIALLLLGGCSTLKNNGDSAVKITRNQQNEQLGQAELDTIIAINRGSEWRVRDRVTANRAVNLRVLLEIAQRLQEAGETAEATRLAIKISKIVVVALQQADDNMNVLPHYPQ